VRGASVARARELPDKVCTNSSDGDKEHEGNKAAGTKNVQIKNECNESFFKYSGYLGASNMSVNSSNDSKQKRPNFQR
jgi:hypothetical protein